jgi:hypothetical protein
MCNRTEPNSNSKETQQELIKNFFEFGWVREKVDARTVVISRMKIAANKIVQENTLLNFF